MDCATAESILEGAIGNAEQSIALLLQEAQAIEKQIVESQADVDDLHTRMQLFHSAALRKLAKRLEFKIAALREGQAPTHDGLG